MTTLANHEMPSGTSQAFEAITLRSSDGSTEAEFVPTANMLCCSLKHHGVEFLHRGAGVDAYADRGITMGIPLLHPWANRLAAFDYHAAGKHVRLQRGASPIATDPAGLPIHGVLPALMHWEVDGREPDALVAVLCWRSPQLLELFPFEHQLRVEIQVGDAELEIATTLYATGQDSVPVCFGYHPYLCIPGIPREAWRVTLGAFRRLVLDEHMIPTGEHEPIERRSLYLEAGEPRRLFRCAFRTGGVRGQCRKRRAEGGLRGGILVRPGLRPLRKGLHLLRADDRTAKRLAQR